MDFSRCRLGYRFLIKILALKNILSNILGFAIIGVSIYGLLYLELEILKFSLLCSIGFAGLYFENSTIKEYIKKGLDKVLK
jgi:hypothetical protein